MSQKLIEIAKVFQTPLKLNAKAGDKILIMTDTQMDPLLWQIGRFAFGSERAAWMRPGERYALQRWPNLTEIPHSAEEIRMIATLANGYLTADELGLLTGSDTVSAQRVLNMLSLMGAVKPASASSSAPPAAAAQSQSQQAQPQPSAQSGSGLFQRLRDRVNGGR